MNATVLASCAVLATLLSLSAWARATDTRAWGDATLARTTAWVLIATTALLQGSAAIAAQGPAAGVALVAAGWMVLGWLFVLAMNTWPAASLRAAQVLGAGALGGCALGLALRALAG